MKLTALQYGTTRITGDMAFPGGDPNKEIPIALLFFLIETAERRILVDTGCDTMPGFPLYTHELPVQTLARLGLSPRDITDVILTHAHHDHAHCARHYPGAQFWIQEEAFDRAKPYLPESGQIRLFRDQASPAEGVTIVHIGGHAKGSCVVELADGTVLCGDECYTRRNLTEKLPTGKPRDPARNLAFLAKYTAPRYRTVLFHDPDLVGGIGTKTL